jgi:hypothetical protein
MRAGLIREQETEISPGSVRTVHLTEQGHAALEFVPAFAEQRRNRRSISERKANRASKSKRALRDFHLSAPPKIATTSQSFAE